VHVKIEDLGQVRGILADMDGVWFVENQSIPGADTALARIRARGLPLRIVTNTTTRSRAQLAEKMRRMGLVVDDNEIIHGPHVAAEYLRARGVGSVKLVIADAIRAEFAGFKESEHPDVIVIGDIGERWNYRLMTELFHLVMDGAEMVALHKGRYWQVANGLALDIGAFVTGLEYATGRTATVVGKPSPEMYRVALADLGLAAGDVVMIGDDIYHDVAGAQSAGIRGVLVKTGKYRDNLVGATGVAPDLIIDSIAVLATVL
jgi:HAD superfamily hydrolase (TIGR01458 family)